MQGPYCSAGAFVAGAIDAGALVVLSAGTLVVLSAGTLLVLSVGVVVLSTGAVLRSGTVPARPVVFNATLLIGGLIPSPFRA